MSVQVEVLVAEAERQIRDGLWELAPGDAALALKTASGLVEAVGRGGEPPVLPGIERLECLREALAVLAIGIARTHGRLAWFLAGASTALAPVLHWRVLPAEHGQSFGTVVPAPEELADAENAIRRLHAVLGGIGTRVAEAPPEDAEPGPVG
ncbi:hypothetical protein [Streptomyces sp. NRRL B-24484]|uniref:hypothetical protein n=1 Tax=Streptomyces sp. NRRL B-24484 TaxID=1463833 RepID=UPI0006932C1B|nr:hypothetical protein [Streptomyces sp. NRRL B-24484]